MLHPNVIRYLIFCGLLWLPTWSFCQVNEPREIGPNEFVLLEREPEPINMNELTRMIGYPPDAKASEIQGKVIIRVQIDTKGNYVKHIIIKNPHPILTQAVESKIAFLKFKPGIQYGKPIKVWVTIPFDFKLLPSDAVETVEPKNLKRVAEDIAKTSFHSLDEALLADPANVKELFLHGKKLTEFPMEVLNFPNLRRLELGDNQLTTIPVEIAQFHSLWYLGLSRNQLTHLPDEVLGMQRLEKIMVDGNLFPKSLQKSMVKSHGELLFPKDDKGKVQW
ncbi:MAG: TonB family protein [Bacteroidetes bacterium]|nr:TonB family protein [Bacteroidota bacterium]MBL0016955.1 TonB family protein [Bacteroidota bacterium]